MVEAVILGRLIQIMETNCALEPRFWKQMELDAIIGIHLAAITLKTREMALLSTDLILAMDKQKHHESVSRCRALKSSHKIDISRNKVRKLTRIHAKNYGEDTDSQQKSKPKSLCNYVNERIQQSEPKRKIKLGVMTVILDIKKIEGPPKCISFVCTRELIDSKLNTQ